MLMLLLTMLYAFCKVQPTNREKEYFDLIFLCGETENIDH